MTNPSLTPGLTRRRLGRTDLEVTFLGFGALEIGRDWGLGDADAIRKPDGETAATVLHAVLDLGINLIDTASAYHYSEERIGNTLATRRGEYVLASKCGEANNADMSGTYYDFSYGAVSRSIDNSLRLLNTDTIDLMQIHFGPDPEKTINDGETVAAMMDARQAGKIRYLGASISGDLALRCIESNDFDVMQLGYSLLDRGDAQAVRLCRENDIGVLIRSGLGGGLLTPKVLKADVKIPPAQRKKIRELLALVDNDGQGLTALALRYLYDNPGISSVLLGTKNIHHLENGFELLKRGLEFPESVVNSANVIAES